MIKQPLLPLKWYNEQTEQQFINLMNTTGKDRLILRTDTIMLLPFQIKRDDRGDAVTQWDLVNYDTGIVANMNTGYLDIVSATENEVTYNWIVMDPRPTYPERAVGFFYYIVSDGIETWYSEVFEVCDLFANLYTDTIFVNPAAGGFDSSSASYSNKRAYLKLCENTANGAVICSKNFDVIYNEPLDLYVYATIGTLGGCGFAAYGDDLKYELREYDAAGGSVAAISNTVTGVEGAKCDQLIPTKTCTASLYIYLDNTEQCWQDIRIYLWPRKLANHTIMNWYDDINFCDIIYNNNTDVDECDFYNYLILPNTAIFNPTYAIDEDSVESDEKEAYPLIQSAQKFYKMEFAGGHYLSDAMSIVRLHNDIKFYLSTGEILYICDFAMNNTPINDYCELIELTFREAACAKTSCEDLTVDECCCPNVENVLDYVAGALPACGAPQTGDRYLHLNALPIYIEECDGAAWQRQTDEEVIGNCVYDEDADASETYKQYWYWNGNGAPPTWWYMANLATVTDNTDGTATLNIGACQNVYPDDIDYFPCPITIQAEYDPGTGFEEIGDPVSGYVANNDGITVTTGAGNFDFRIRYYMHNCDLSYSGDVNQNITDV